MNETQVKAFLYKTAWSELGLGVSLMLREYIRVFLLTPQYKAGKEQYWDNPLLERGGVQDDLTLQRFQNYTKEEFINFLVERFEYETQTTPLPRGYNGEVSV